MSNAVPHIRPAHPDDVDTLLAIAAHSLGAALWTEAQYRQIFAPASPQRCVLVIEDAGALAGFIVGLIIADEWEVENIAVRADSQGRGLGSTLLAAFVAEAQRTNAARIHLEVRASNSAALRLYTKAGFQQMGRRAGYYSAPPEDALLLVLQLS